jgi:hypothetical protein
MAAFDYRQAREIRDVFGLCHVRYLFLGKSGAILLGYPDTTQDAARFEIAVSRLWRSLFSSCIAPAICLI